jgi:hypothetical protein
MSTPAYHKKTIFAIRQLDITEGYNANIALNARLVKTTDLNNWPPGVYVTQNLVKINLYSRNITMIIIPIMVP